MKAHLVRVVYPVRPPQAFGMDLEPVPSIEPIPDAVLRLHLTDHAQIVNLTQNKDGEIIETPAHPPAWLTCGVSQCGDWPGMRALQAIVTTPTLLPDGSVLQQPGFHKDSGLFLHADGDYPSIPTAPTLFTLLQTTCDSRNR